MAMTTSNAPGTVALYVSAPVACFRAPQAREYLETLALPPPSTVYGMLLSLVGEPNRLVHAGAEVALVLLGEHEPGRSTVLRTAWRIKDANVPPGLGSNKRHDFQELLTDVELAVLVRTSTNEAADLPLATRVEKAIADPSSVRRYGGLYLGESTHLVNEVRRLRPDDGLRPRVLVADPTRDLPLPIWPDHVGSARTRWGQFALREVTPSDGVPDGLALSLPAEAWIPISPPK